MKPRKSAPSNATFRYAVIVLVAMLVAVGLLVLYYMPIAALAPPLIPVPLPDVAGPAP